MRGVLRILPDVSFGMVLLSKFKGRISRWQTSLVDFFILVKSSLYEPKEKE